MVSTATPLATSPQAWPPIPSATIASQMAVETMVEFFRTTQEETESTWPFKVDAGYKYDTNRLITAIKLANLRIFEAAQRESQYRGMGTTIVSTLFLDDKIVIGHVGDSRVYRLRENELEQLTEDHSLINDYIKMKRMTADEASAWPHKNVIVRALGMKESVQVDILTENPHIGDCFILCTDGLSGMIADQRIRDIVTHENDLDRACEKLIGAANAAGGADNITVVLARLEPVR